MCFPGRPELICKVRNRGLQFSIFNFLFKHNNLINRKACKFTDIFNEDPFFDHFHGGCSLLFPFDLLLVLDTDIFTFFNPYLHPLLDHHLFQQSYPSFSHIVENFFIASSPSLSSLSIIFENSSYISFGTKCSR